MSWSYRYRAKPKPHELSKEELRRQLQQAVENTAKPAKKKQRKKKTSS